MKLFVCKNCKELIYFENVACLHCGSLLGYLPDKAVVSAMRLDHSNDVWRAQATWRSGKYRMCANYSNHGVCNWMVPVEENDAFCLACRLNTIIPDLSYPGNKERWRRLEAAKRRLLYSLMRLRLPIKSRAEDPIHGLTFEFLADPDPNHQESQEIMTGHSQGRITINIAEADDAVRELTRLKMGETYRTLLGHFRHEIGHYYWKLCIDGTSHLKNFRQLFGDENLDYDASLQRYYTQGPAPDWQQRCVSSYASAHPWEDWAETWAHYLHIIDTLETAASLGMRINPRVVNKKRYRSHLPTDIYRTHDFKMIMSHWLPLTHAMNSLNRSMGQGDAYPFVLSALSVSKLNFVHQVVRQVSRA